MSDKTWVIEGIRRTKQLLNFENNLIAAKNEESYTGCKAALERIITLYEKELENEKKVNS